MFDSNQMHELAALSRDRYQRNGGGGVSKVYNSSKAYHDARGVKDMSAFRRAAYEATVLFRQAASMAAQDFRFDCLLPTLDTDANGYVPF
jgi:hypothetical protein